AVQGAVKRAVKRGTTIGGPFYVRPDQVVITRDRSNVSSQTLRRLEMLPPVEIEHAMLEIVAANYGAGREELIQATSRAFGFVATSTS
ncbi:MAG: hypothetical protein KDA51_12635, partial [Planctomycetales bacterium]|nr:hypothetical protein [Planctomycetales bacterium]